MLYEAVFGLNRLGIDAIDLLPVVSEPTAGDAAGGSSRWLRPPWLRQPGAV